VLVSLAAASCDAPAPVRPELTPLAQGYDERAALQLKVAALEQLLNGNTFDRMLAGPYAHLAAGQRQSVVDALTKWRAELAALGGPISVANQGEELVSEHWCMQNGTLNDCFTETSSTIATNGTGRVKQASYIIGQSPTTVSIANPS
jgi:hypothetical protein